MLIAVALMFSLAGCFLAAKPTNSEPESDSQEEEAQPEDSGSVKPANTRPDDEGEATEASEEDKATEQELFAAFIDEQFKESIESSYFATHIYYIDPESAGINMENVEVGFGTAPTPEELQESRDYYKELSDELATFNRSLLTPEQQIEYDSIKWELTIVKVLSDEKFDYYEQFFAPPNSLEANLVSYLSSFEIRHERDAKDMATLLNSVPGYIESCIAYAKEQQKRELLMTDFDAVIEGCQDIIDMGMDSSVLSKLLEHVDNIEAEQSAKDKYKEDITAAFRDSYLPSFQKIIDAMNEMRDGYNNTKGYAAFPNGKEYYEAKLMYATGTLASAEEIYDYLQEKSDSLLNRLFSIYTKYSSDVDAYYNGSITSGFTSYQEILDSNKEALLADYPEVKNLEYHIENADPEEKLAEKNIAAYFLIPPLDGDRVQQMRVEPTGRDLESLDTYITVSHEGFPGHMYHYAYLYSNIESPYVKTLGVDAVIEGYAVYAEIEALKYLSGVKLGVRELVKVSTALSYADYSLADIGINYYGWDVDKVYSFFTDIGYSVDMKGAQEIYDYLRCTPCAYEPYGYGYLRLADLREKAQSELGDKFNTLAFNTAMLKPGPVPFEILEEYIGKYIEENK